MAQRSATLIANQLYSDMHFYIELENVEIPAHRSIVSTASPVLDKFLCGSGNLPASQRITVSDISVRRFGLVLDYIYTDAAAIDVDNALDVLRVAHYLDLTNLEEMCVETLLRTLTIYNVCTLYPQTYMLSVRLATKCEQLIQAKTDWLLANGQLFAMAPAAFREILKLDRLNVRRERDIYAALLKWAGERCAEQGLASTARNRRQALGNARLAYVRFTAMTMDEFLECLTLEPAFFSSDEVAEITEAIRTGRPLALDTTEASEDGIVPDRLRFHSNVRRTVVVPEIKTSQLFHWCSRGSNYRNFPPEQFTVYSVSPVLVHGIGMYGRNGLHIADGQERVLPVREIVYDPETELSRLMFAEPFVVKPEDKHHQLTAFHDPAYGKFFYFIQMEYKERRNVFFGYHFRAAYTNKYIRVVEIYYEDLV